MIDLESFKQDLVDDFNKKLNSFTTPTEGTLTIEQIQAVPPPGSKCLDKPEHLFHFYRDMKFPCGKREQKVHHDVFVDLHRTDIGNMAYAQEHRNGKNPLFNVLMAYAHFDPEVSYCQGMNLLASWILKYTQQVNSRGVLEYNEQDAFYLLIHVLVRLQWREVYKPSMTRVMEMCTLLGEILSTTYPEVYDHLYETSGLEVNTMIQYLFSS